MVTQTERNRAVELPVKVKVGGKIMEGVVRGRSMAYPMVFVGDAENGSGWEFTWEAVVRAQNVDRCLQI